MKKKLFKYTIRIVLGFFTLLWGLGTWAVLYPDESYHHCESGQEEMSATTCVILTGVSRDKFDNFMREGLFPPKGFLENYQQYLINTYKPNSWFLQ